MIALICFVLAVLASPFKSKSRLEAENAVLRHQLIVLQRKVRGRAHLTNNDRWFFVQMYRWFPSILKVVTIIEPETLVRWHRAGFRRYWRWKSRSIETAQGSGLGTAYDFSSTVAAARRRYKSRLRASGNQSYRNISRGRQFATQPRIRKLSSTRRLNGLSIR
jgi:type II secretory pathway pseudopilin PulG